MARKIFFKVTVMESLETALHLIYFEKLGPFIREK